MSAERIEPNPQSSSASSQAQPYTLRKSPQMESEEATIQSRLAIDERPLKRLVKAVKTCTNVEQEIQIYSLHQMFLQAQKHRLENDLLAVQQEAAACNADIACCKEKQQVLKAEIQQDRDRHAALQEYDRIASLILGLQSREASEVQLSALQTTLYTLNEQNEQLDQLFEETLHKLDTISDSFQLHLQQNDSNLK